jgi:hypothetical protein
MTSELIDVGALRFRVVGHPRYSEAHPGEACEADETCERCAIGEEIGTGTRALLWLCGGVNWSINRADPRYAEIVSRCWGKAP